MPLRLLDGGERHYYSWMLLCYGDQFFQSHPLHVAGHYMCWSSKIFTDSSYYYGAYAAHHTQHYWSNTHEEVCTRRAMWRLAFQTLLLFRVFRSGRDSHEAPLLHFPLKEEFCEGWKFESSCDCSPTRALFARPPLTGDWCAPCQQYRVTSHRHFLPDNSMTSTKQSDGEVAFAFG